MSVAGVVDVGQPPAPRGPRLSHAAASRAELLVRMLAVALSLVLARTLAPREIGIAAVVVTLAAVIAEASARAALAGRGPLVDDRRGADLAPALTALVFSTSLAAALYIGRDVLAGLLATFEVGRMAWFAVPLAVAGAATMALRRAVQAPRLGAGTFLIAAAGLGAFLALAGSGKTIGALLVGACVVLACEGIAALRSARILPTRDSIRVFGRTLRASLAQLPVSLGLALLRRLDLLVAVATFGAETGGTWCIARALTFEIGRVPAGVFPRWRAPAGARDPRRAVEIAMLPWLVGLALLAQEALPELLGPRLGEAGRVIPLLALGSMPVLLASALARARTSGTTAPVPSLFLASTATLFALSGFEAMVLGVALGLLLRGGFGLARAAQQDPRVVRAAIVPAMVGALVVGIAVAGTRDLLLALGRPGDEIVLAAASIAAIVHVMVAVGWAPFERRSRGRQHLAGS